MSNRETASEQANREERQALQRKLSEQHKEPGEISDGYHTFNELYEFRMLYHAHLVNAWEIEAGFYGGSMFTVKSWKHSDGELCFGGGWFIVVTETAEGQISNHYEEQHWDLFKVPEVDLPPEFDGHSAADVLVRLRALLGGDDEPPALEAS